MFAHRLTLSLKKKLFIPFILCFSFILGACSGSELQPKLDLQGTLAAKVSGTLTAAPTINAQSTAITPIPIQTQTPVPTASFNGLPGLVNVANIVMRSGPSTLFDRITTFPQGTQVTVLGRTLNDEWVWVTTTEASQGWMSAQFLEITNLASVPILEVGSSVTISGNAIDTDNNGLDGVNIAVFQGNGADRRRTDTYTGLDGSFTVYLPDTSQGIWNVEAVGIKCSSRVMDAFCKSSGSITNPGFLISLPQSISITFIYDPTKP